MAVAINREESEATARLTSRVSSAFKASLTRAFKVAGETEDGRPKQTTQIQLSEKSGVARSTLAKYLDLSADNKLVNPDLEILCRLAHALNISPAYLLMTPDDWRALTTSVATLIAAAKIQALDKLPSIDPSEANSWNPAQQALAGLAVAKTLGIAPLNFASTDFSASHPRIADELSKMNARARRSLLATCALPPVPQVKDEFKRVLLYLCAIIGANNK